MASNKTIYKKYDLQKFISGKLNIPNQLVEVSTIKTYTNSPVIKIFPDFILSFFTFSLTLAGLLIISFSSKEISSDNLFGMLGILSFSLGMINMNAMFNNYKKNIRTLKDRLREPIEEIFYLNEYLIAYLKALNNRTQKYFAQITNNKVANFLLITNISQELQAVVDYIQNLTAKININNLYDLDAIIRSSITVYDGVGLSAGNAHNIELAKLAETIDVLVHNMEQSVKLLDEEFKISPIITE